MAHHTIIVVEIKKKSLNYCYLLSDLAPWLTLSGLNYPRLGTNFHGPKGVRAIEVRLYIKKNEPAHDKTYKMTCAPSEASDKPGHPPNLIIVFAVRRKKPKVLSYTLSAQRRFWLDWADAKADLYLRWAHMSFVGFVMRWLKSKWRYSGNTTVTAFPRHRKRWEEEQMMTKS